MDRFPVIVGSGFSALIAAAVFPSAQIISDRPLSLNHHALLRFRSDTLSSFFRIPFQKVIVRKSIFDQGIDHTRPSIRLANAYSQKTRGTILPNDAVSLWDLDPVERFVAPPDLYDRMVERTRAQDRFSILPLEQYFSEVKTTHHPIISTAPLPSALNAVGLPVPEEFPRHAKITTFLANLTNVNTYQTIYFPNNSDSGDLYRASITGHRLIAELVGDHDELSDDLWAIIRKAFGLRVSIDEASTNHFDRRSQGFGKIAPFENDAQRRSLIYSLTREHNIFSLGRFATWRNILLDDTLQDAFVIEKLIASDDYSRSLHANWSPF